MSSLPDSSNAVTSYPLNDAPRPCAGSVVVEVMKIVDIDQPQAVIVNHIELVVPVLRERSTPSRSHGSRS